VFAALKRMRLYRSDPPREPYFGKGSFWAFET
jgi:hypothetical protein